MTSKDYVNEAARAHTNLSVFAIVKSLMESGSVYGYNRTAEKIGKLCDVEVQRQLRLYDHYTAKAKERV
jgi:hypothetical protein